MNLLKRAFDFFVFTSIYIACCAILMTAQTNQLLQLHYDIIPYLSFVFFSTICSYNFHWYLTPDAETEKMRVKWTQRHKLLHLILFCIGAAGSAWYYFYFIEHWFWLSGAAILTFLYSAPKLAFRPFLYLRKIAIGKTIFLSFVWVYVTTVLPVIFSERGFTGREILFCISRFFLVYAICIIFDYRDRINDRKEGVRSMITYFSERGINRLFHFSLLIFLLSAIALYCYGFSPLVIGLWLSPGVLVLWIYSRAKNNFSDYLYYVILDGLMMFSALLTLPLGNV